MKVVEALEHLGVGEDTLSPQEKAFLDTNGYLALTGMLTGQQVQAFNSLLEQIVEDEASLEEETDFQEGTRIVRDLVSKDPLFHVCFTDVRILACARHVIGDDFKLSSLVYRSVLPGGGRQALHPDWHPEWWRDRKTASDRFSCNSIWMLDDFTPDNGGTRIVPGSHNGLTFPEDEMEDPRQPHPGEIQLTGKAGTAAAFTGHTWHAGARNGTDAPRRAVLAYFCRGDQPQQQDYRSGILPEAYAWLSEEGRVLLDVADGREGRGGRRLSPDSPAAGSG